MHRADCFTPPWPGFHMGAWRHPRPHRPPPWFADMMGPPPRVGRGEVRYLILDAIKDQPRHGYEIIQTIADRSKGSYRPSPGTIYPTLQMLDEMGLVKTRQRDERTQYEITEAGLAELAAHQDELDESYDRLGGGDDWSELFDLEEMGRQFRRMMRAIGKSFRRGRIGGKEMKSIYKVIEEAVDKIEKIARGE